MANPTIIDSWDLNGTNINAISAALQNDGYSEYSPLPSGDVNAVLKQIFESIHKSKDDGVWDWEDPLTSGTTYKISSLTRYSGNIYFSLINANTSTPSDDGINWVDITKQYNLQATKTIYNIISDANYTLTYAQNKSGNIEITDTGIVLTAGRDIIIDAIGRIFLFTNNTAQELTVKVSGGIGISIPAGVTSILINDGSDVNLLQTVDPINDYDLVNKRYIDNLVSPLPTITGIFTATNATNNINLTGVGSLTNLEVGDVIQILGTTTAQNDGYFTVEVITDANNIIVNQAHAGGTTSKSLIDETSTTSVTISIFCKWYNAPIGLGQGWVSVTSSRSAGVTYTNTTSRSISVNIRSSTTSATNAITASVGGLINNIAQGSAASGTALNINFIAPSINTYSCTSTNATIVIWSELR